MKKRLFKSLLISVFLIGIFGVSSVYATETVSDNSKDELLTEAYCSHENIGGSVDYSSHKTWCKDCGRTLTDMTGPHVFDEWKTGSDTKEYDTFYYKSYFRQCLVCGYWKTKGEFEEKSNSPYTNYWRKKYRRRMG